MPTTTTTIYIKKYNPSDVTFIISVLNPIYFRYTLLELTERVFGCGVYVFISDQFVGGYYQGFVFNQ